MAVRSGRYKGLTAEERHVARREKLLEAALELWGSEGGPTVTMTRICAEAGLTERYFYESFENLDVILIAVMESIADEIGERVIAALDAATGGPEQRVRAAIAEFVAILTEDPRKGWVAIVESASVDAVRPRRAEMLRRFADLSQFEARGLYGARALDEAEGRMAATMFIGGVAELITGWLEGNIEATPEQITDIATRHFTAMGHR